MNREKLQLRRLGENDKVAAFDCGDRNDSKAGCRFVTVDAYADALPFYYKMGFIPLSKDDEDAPTRLLYFDLESVKASE